MNVVLVHGFWNQGALFRRLQRRLEAAGHTCHAPTLHPRDGRHGLPDLGQKLADFIDLNLPAGIPFAIVAFSMGCLVSKYYLQSGRNHRPVRAFFAISGPMQGTLTAWLYPGKGARDMRPGSQFLREMEAPAPPASSVPVYTYFTPLDLMILPATSSRIANAREFCVPAPWHRAMLWNPAVARDILENLKGL